MPEGDTLRRTADVLARVLAGQTVTAARGRAGGARLDLVVGDDVEAVRTMGKHLLIEFSSDLVLHTHLAMNGAWHRYRRDEPWQLDESRAVAVVEVERGVAVCFDAPTVELLERRALALHPVLRQLGPDLLDAKPDIDGAVERTRDPRIMSEPIAVALLDQRVAAGMGNVYRSEILFIERVDPFEHAGALDAAVLRRLFETGARLLRINLDGGDRATMPDASGAYSNASQRSRRDARLWVYGRTGRPCRRCGSLIRSTSIGSLPRRLYWCPTCQASSTPTSSSP